MGVTIAYHFGGNFGYNGTAFSYNGGDVATILDVEEDKVNVVDLGRGLRAKIPSVGAYKLYFKDPSEEGVDSFRIILSDDHVNKLLKAYNGRDTFDIYVEAVANVIHDDELSDESEDDSYVEFSDDEEDSDFEVGPWISDEDREDFELVKQKVKEVKEKLKNGVPFLCGHNGDGYESDGHASDEYEYYEEVDPDDETGEHTVKRRCPFPKYDKNNPKPYFETSMIFRSMKEVRGALRKHAITERRDIRKLKNEKGRVRAVCKWTNCKWLFYVSINSRFRVLQLKTYVPHVCPEHYHNSYISPSFIANHYKQRIKSNPRWKNKLMRETVREDFGADVTVMQCSRAKSQILRTTFPAYVEEYGLLRNYGEEILRTSPGSSVKIMVDTNNPSSTPYFQRMYICFDELKKGFLAGCRRVISIDGCFLKGLCKGELLTAIGRDANDQMYPVAWCVVEVESRASWTWFLQQLEADLQIGDGTGWCISSDQQKGLLACVETLFPKAQHRLCARHLYSNWRKKYRNLDWQEIFWLCAKSSTEFLLSRHKDELSSHCKEGAEAMMQIDPKKWCRAYFTTAVKCDSVDNNMSESFNALILESRHKPILSMLEDIRITCMEQIAVKREIAEKWNGVFCPKILSKLDNNAKIARYCHLVSNGKDGYEVRQKVVDKTGKEIAQDRYRVHLANRTCSCRSWELTGVPCSHAITCMVYERKDPQTYIHDHYTVTSYWKTYDHVMLPMDGHTAWVRSSFPPVLPPMVRRMPGRPKKNRVKSVEEKGDKVRKRNRAFTDEQLLARDANNPNKLTRVGRLITCKNCGRDGHNARSCHARQRMEGGQYNVGDGPREDAGARPAGIEVGAGTAPSVGFPAATSHGGRSTGNRGGRSTGYRGGRSRGRGEQGAEREVQGGKKRFEGHGVCFNEKTGQIVADPGRPTERVISHGSSSKSKDPTSTQESCTTGNKGGSNVP